MSALTAAKFLVVIDSTVENYQDLIQGAVSGAEVIVLDSQQDGVEQITAALRDRPSIESLHIVSHGAPGTLYLGNTALSLASLDRYAWDLQAWSVPSILLYGCNVAAGDAGSEFIEKLHSLTGANIAASTTVTGHAALGGNWELDVKTTSAPVTLAFNESVKEWQGTLPATINPTGGSAADGSDGLRIILADDGSYQIYYRNNNQVFGSGDSATVVGIGNATVGSSYASPDRNWDKLGQTSVAGTGSQADPFAVTTSLFDDVDNDDVYDVGEELKLDYTVAYVSGNPYFSQTFQITAPTNNTQAIKLHQGMDTYLAGGDAGPAYGLNSTGTAISGTSDNPVLIGTVKNLGQPGESFLAYVQSGRTWDSWYSGYYYDQFDQVRGGGDLTKTYDPNPSTDNGIGVQYNLGAITGVVTVRNKLTFDASTAVDLATNNAPTTTGTTQTLTYTPNGGAVDFAAITVTDPDTGDVITASFTLSDTSAGSLSSSAGGTYNSNTGIWSISGTATQVNAAIDVLQFIPASGFSQSANIQVRISDGTDILDTTIPLQASGGGTPGTPGTPQLDPNVFGNSGANATNNNQPPLTGTAQPGSTIQVFAGETVIGTATADNTGKWNFVPSTPLADGTYNVTVKTTSGGVTSTSPNFPLTIDTRPATVEILNYGAKVRDTSVNSLSFKFNEVVSNFDLSDVSLTFKGQAIDLTGVTLSTTDNQTWTLSGIPGMTAPSGDYQIAIKAGKVKDVVGNLMQVGNSDTWLTGYTADAMAPIKQGGKRGLRFKGNDGNNGFRGGRDRDTILGGNGNDQLFGMGGNDRLIGGTGDDRMRGGAGKDRLVGGNGRDKMRGGAGSDMLVGGKANDLLVGNNGDDILFGGAGKDTLIGGAGKDAYLYRSLGDAGDRIVGFNGEQDLIDVRGIFAAPQFSGDNRFAQFQQFIQIAQVGANTEVRVDADGKGAGTAFVTLATLVNTNANAISSTNFVIG